MPSSDTQGPGPSTDHNSAGTRQVPQAPGHALGSPFPHYFSTSYFWPVSQGPCLTPTPSPPADDLISSLQKNRGYLAGIPSKFLHTPLFLCRLPLISQHLAPPLPSVVTGRGILSAIRRSPSTCSQTPSPPIIASLPPLSLLSLPLDSSFTSFTLHQSQAPEVLPLHLLCLESVSSLNIRCLSAATRWRWPGCHKGHSSHWNRQIQWVLGTPSLVHLTSLLLTPQVFEPLSSLRKASSHLSDSPATPVTPLGLHCDSSHLSAFFQKQDASTTWTTVRFWRPLLPAWTFLSSGHKYTAA